MGFNALELIGKKGQKIQEDFVQNSSSSRIKGGRNPKDSLRGKIFKIKKGALCKIVAY